MGAYDGAEVWESVGTILLEKINEICNKINIGLDRDDVLSIFRNKLYLSFAFNSMTSNLVYISDRDKIKSAP